MTGHMGLQPVKMASWEFGQEAPGSALISQDPACACYQPC